MHQPAPVTQQAEARGRGNVIVQITGDGNTVVAGHAHLTLTRYLTRRQRTASDIDLLSPYTRSIRLIGRARELEDLGAWLDGEQPIAVRVLTGSAGTGKTRLAIELIEARHEAWDAGFVESGELERFRAQHNLATWGWRRPTLVVVDYAAVHAELLAKWFQELADNQGDGAKPLRILLLERHAQAGSGWWQTAFGRGGFGALAVQRLLDPPEPIPLAPLAALEARRAVMGATLDQAGSDARPPTPGADRLFDQQLAELTWGGEPLFLMMAGLLARDAGIGNLLALSRTDLAVELAERELARIARLAEAGHLDPDFMQAMAAYVTLCGGLDTAALRVAVPAEQAALGLPGAGDPGRVAKVLQAALPGAPAMAEPIRPDLIGEAAVLQALERQYGADGPAVVLRAFAQIGPPVSATVIRTAQDFASAGHHQPLAWLDALTAQGSVAVEQLMLIADQLPQTSLALVEHATRITETIVAIMRARVRQGDADHEPTLAANLNNLSVRLSALGRREDALAAAEEARDLDRALAEARPDAFTPDLALSLNNLATMLSDLGRREDALAAAEEARDLYRALAEARPDAFTPDLAGSLNNLANRLSALGRREDALAAAEEARDLYRALAEARPDVFTPYLATSLNNLANMLSDLGRREDALAAAEEAVALRRRLAEARPDAFTPYLAMSLNNLANRLSALGRREDALAAAEEARDLDRALAEARPDAFTPDLAMSLNNLANRLSALGRREAALAAAEEARDLYRALAEARPDAFTPDLAMSLNNLAPMLRELGQREAALAAAEEARDLYRALAEARPDAFTPDLAMSLNNLAPMLSDLGRHEAALAAAEEARDLYRALAEARPDVFTPYLATSLNNLANMLSDLGRREDALAAAEEAVALGRRLAEARPDAFTPNLAMSLNNLANTLSDLGRREDALAAAEEAVALRRRLAEARPDAFTPYLAGSLNNLATMLSALGRREDALAAAEEAVALRRRLAEARPDAFTPDLAVSLAVLANGLDAVERAPDALAANREAIVTLSPAFLAHPPAFAHWMLPMCQQYLERCQKLDEEPDAAMLGPIAEALQRLQAPPGASADQDGGDDG